MQQRAWRGQSFPITVLALACGMLVLEAAEGAREHVAQVRGELELAPVLVSGNHPRLNELDELMVVGVSLNGRSRAYMVDQREHVINDRLGDVPIAMHYCGMVNACGVFARQYENEVIDLQFKMPGLLAAADSSLLWLQTSGKNLQGGSPLQELPSVYQPLGEWRRAHPDTDVVVTPAMVDEPVASERVTAVLMTGPALASFGEIVGGKLLGVTAVLMISLSLLSVVVFKLVRQLRNLRGEVDQLKRAGAERDLPNE